MSEFSLDFSAATYFQPASTSNLEPKIQQHAGIADKEALKCDFAELLSSKKGEDLPERRIPVITLMSRVPSSAQSRSMYVSRSAQAVICSFSVSKLEYY